MTGWMTGQVTQEGFLKEQRSEKMKALQQQMKTWSQGRVRRVSRIGNRHLSGPLAGWGWVGRRGDWGESPSRQPLSIHCSQLCLVPY